MSNVVIRTGVPAGIVHMSSIKDLSLFEMTQFFIAFRSEEMNRLKIECSDVGK